MRVAYTKRAQVFVDDLEREVSAYLYEHLACDDDDADEHAAALVAIMLRVADPHMTVEVIDGGAAPPSS